MDVQARTIGNPDAVNIKTLNPCLYLVNNIDSKVFIIKIKERVLLLSLPGSIGKSILKGGISLKIHILIPCFIGGFVSLFEDIPEDKKFPATKYHRFIKKYTDSHTMCPIDIAAELFLGSKLRIHFTKALHSVMQGISGKKRTKDYRIHTQNLEIR